MVNGRSISFVIATYNRRETLLSTLQRLHSSGAGPHECEIIVVDNASSDGTADAVRSCFPDVRLVGVPRNLGSCAKACGVDWACGDYVVFLDDDSYPRSGTVERMVARFDSDQQLGAAGFMIHLPDGQRECSALPHVFVGCGAGLRREALLHVGGLDRSLFMQAEEYDLCFRLVHARWRVETFADLHVDHLKTRQARVGRRTVYYDTRNNLLLTARYLPDDYERAYREDWLQRYAWIAAGAGHLSAYWRGRFDGWRRRRRERRTHARWRLSPADIEVFFRPKLIAQRMNVLAAEGVRDLILADLGKNTYPFARSATEAGIDVRCIADDRFAAPGRYYRGIPLWTVCKALATPPDAVVVSNTSPAHAILTQSKLAALTDAPIHRWFGYDRSTAESRLAAQPVFEAERERQLEAVI